MVLNTDHLDQGIKTLDLSLKLLSEQTPNTAEYHVMRSAVIKEFELTLETSNKMLRKALKMTAGTSSAIDRLPFKDVFRMALKHAMIDAASVPRWFSYRDNRNETAHDYGADFAEKPLKIVPSFLEDARILSQSLNRYFLEFA